MRLHRFHVSVELQARGEMIISDEKLIKQWSKVLRYKRGQKVILFDGQGKEAECTIVSISPKGAHLLIENHLSPRTPVRDVHLFWSLLKKNNNELIIQKATELGITHFHPIISDRCEKSDISRVQSERWNRICIEASEQCGRGDIPVVEEVMGLRDVVKGFGASIAVFIADQSAELSAQIEIAGSQAIGGLVGPEGGWSQDEQDMFTAAELLSINLSANTLRAETAAIMMAGSLVRL